MKKVLVVVDVQKDFYHPDGALYVKGGEILPERIAKVIPEFDAVVFTVDWHPYNHCSFKENGGIWPIHCVQYTEGASLPNEFMQYIKPQGLFCNVVTKGRNDETEEYGAHLDIKSHLVDEVVFCGIHALYCVKETIKNFISEYPEIKISVIVDCIAPLECEEFKEFCSENGITQKSMSDF